MRKTKSTLKWPLEILTLEPRSNATDRSSKPKLAALKENPEYVKFYAKIKSKLLSYPTRKVNREIQDPLEKQAIALQRGFEEFKKSSPSFLRHCEELDFDIDHLRVLLMARRISSNEVLDLLDPQKNLKDLYSSYPERTSKLEKVLPKLFLGSPAVRNYTLTDPIARLFRLEQYGSPHVSLRPYKLYLVDLGKGKSQILREFKSHIHKQFERLKKIHAQGEKRDSPFKKDDRGRPPKERHRTLAVYQIYSELKDRMEYFVSKCRKSQPQERKKLFKVEFPDLSDYAIEALRHRSAKEIAKAIVRLKYGIKPRTLLTMIKRAERMPDK